MISVYEQWVKVDDLAIKAIELSLPDHGSEIIERIRSDYAQDIGIIGLLRRTHLEAGFDDAAQLYWGSRREPTSPRLESVLGQLLLNIAASAIFEVLRELGRDPSQIAGFIESRAIAANVMHAGGLDLAVAWVHLSRIWQLHRWKRAGVIEPVRATIREMLEGATIHVDIEGKTASEVEKIRQNLLYAVRGLVIEEIERSGDVVLPANGRTIEGTAASYGLGFGAPVCWPAAGRLKPTGQYVLAVPPMLVDGEGRAMTTSHATKPGVRYRYYNTRSDLLDGSPAWRVSAHDLEQLVCNRIAELLTDQQSLRELLGDRGDHAQALQSIIEAGDVMAAQLRSGTVAARQPIVAAIVDQVALHGEAIEITVAPHRLLLALGYSVETIVALQPLVLTCPATRVRKGHQLRLVIPASTAPSPAPTRNEKLVALMSEAYSAQQLLATHPGQPIAVVAKLERRCRSRLTQLLALSCLAPDIVTAIIEGRQPATLTARGLSGIDLPLRWPEQRVALGFS